MLKQQTVSAVLHRSSRTIATSISPTHNSQSSAPPPPPPPQPAPVVNNTPPSPPLGSISRPKMTTSDSGSARSRSSDDARPPKSAPSMFTLGYKEAAYQWWTSVTPPMVEHKVLSFMPNLKEAIDTLANPSAVERTYPAGTRVWRRNMVKLSGKNRGLNEVMVERVGEEADEAVVMIHGYGAGLGFFYRNLEPLSRAPGTKLYALDLLGMGNSTRPPFKIHARTKEEQIMEAENWFVDALEEWRVKRKIERFTLLGHSLGGYLAVSYALRYPGHLKKLILASPVGVPKDPYAVDAAMPEPNESTLETEFTQDQNASTDKSTPVPPKRPLPSWLVWLWDANVSPFSLVRMSGPLGPRIVSGWSSRRFNHLPADEAQALHDYSFSIFKQRGSGEYALAYLLAPGAYARRPVIDRIQDVGRQTIPGETPSKETGIPIVFMYGENDWMDVAGGLAAEEKLKKARRNALLNGTDEEKRSENGSVKVVVIPKAGHHLYLDNPDQFNSVVCEELEKTRRDEKNRQISSSSSA